MTSDGLTVNHEGFIFLYCTGSDSLIATYTLFFFVYFDASGPVLAIRWTADNIERIGFTATLIVFQEYAIMAFMAPHPGRHSDHPLASAIFTSELLFSCPAMPLACRPYALQPPRLSFKMFFPDLPELIGA
ncbi:hypothetical protein DL96DRAFT_1558119 [Flagelloscypha sp. PMI_526]|nr:hypothetical protein DL96DRAFT_1558119 [Flagelloscypha sp. PMI_526]